MVCAERSYGIDLSRLEKACESNDDGLITMSETHGDTRDDDECWFSEEKVSFIALAIVSSLKPTPLIFVSFLHSDCLDPIFATKA